MYCVCKYLKKYLSLSLSRYLFLLFSCTVRASHWLWLVLRLVPSRTVSLFSVTRNGRRASARPPPGHAIRAFSRLGSTFQIWFSFHFSSLFSSVPVPRAPCSIPVSSCQRRANASRLSQSVRPSVRFAVESTPSPSERRHVETSAFQRRRRGRWSICRLSNLFFFFWFLFSSVKIFARRPRRFGTLPIHHPTKKIRDSRTLV